MIMKEKSTLDFFAFFMEQLTENLIDVINFKNMENGSLNQSKMNDPSYFQKLKIKLHQIIHCLAEQKNEMERFYEGKIEDCERSIIMKEERIQELANQYQKIKIQNQNIKAQNIKFQGGIKQLRRQFEKIRKLAPFDNKNITKNNQYKCVSLSSLNSPIGLKDLKIFKGCEENSQLKRRISFDQDKKFDINRYFENAKSQFLSPETESSNKNDYTVHTKGQNWQQNGVRNTLRISSQTNNAEESIFSNNNCKKYIKFSNPSQLSKIRSRKTKKQNILYLGRHK